MLGFFKDAQLKNRVTPETPKKFVLPTVGGEKTTSLWIGDLYHAIVRQASNAGANRIDLDQTTEFFNSGTAIVNGNTITYTSKSATSLLGVTGLSVKVAVGDVVVPNKVWKA